jgi:hypothetical protein
MAEVYIDIEWGETPFAYGDPPWPSPLVQPEPWPEDLEAGGGMEGIPKVTVPDELLARWKAAVTEFIACQKELTRLAAEQGAFE